MALTEPTPAPPPQRGPPGAAWPIYLERKVTPGLTPGPKRHTVPPDARTSLDSAENEFDSEIPPTSTQEPVTETTVRSLEKNSVEN